MNTDFINIPEKDLKGPETESDQYAEEVRQAVQESSGHSSEDKNVARSERGS